MLWVYPNRHYHGNCANGLQSGSIYALVALGYSMVYGIIMLLNFAHGDIIMVGAYIVWLMMARFALNPIIALLAAIVGCTALGVVIEKAAYKPLRSSPRISLLITAIGISYFLENAAQLIFGANARVIPPFINAEPITVGTVSIPARAAAATLGVRLAAEVREALIAVLEELRELVFKRGRGIAVAATAAEIPRSAALALRAEGRIPCRSLCFWLLLLKLLDGKGNLAAIIDAQYLNLHLVMFGEEIVDILDIDIRYLRDMDETRLAFRQFYESTEIRDARDQCEGHFGHDVFPAGHDLCIIWKI